MKTDYLLPNFCKKIGWIISSLFVLLYIWAAVNDYIYNHNQMEIMPSWLSGDIYTILIVGLSISLLMVAFSKEKDEDEYTVKIRGKSLILAVVTSYIILIIAALCLYFLDFLTFMGFNMFTIPILYILKFNITLRKLRKSARYEK